jgi:hypothetical protein
MQCRKYNFDLPIGICIEWLRFPIRAEDGTDCIILPFRKPFQKLQAQEEIGTNLNLLPINLSRPD